MGKLGALLSQAAVAAAVYGVLTFIGRRWIEATINSRFDKLLEDYKFELKTREQAAKIAEYASVASSLKDTDDAELYRRANELSWELFLWLRDDVYRKLGRGLADKASKKELVEALVDVRKEILGDKAGTLGPNDIIIHAPNIGRPKPAP